MRCNPFESFCENSLYACSVRVFIISIKWIILFSFVLDIVPYTKCYIIYDDISKIRIPIRCLTDLCILKDKFVWTIKTKYTFLVWYSRIMYSQISIYNASTREVRHPKLGAPWFQICWIQNLFYLAYIMLAYTI